MANTKVEEKALEGPKLPDGAKPEDFFLVKGQYVDCNGRPAAIAMAEAAGKTEAQQVAEQAAVELAAKDAELDTLRAELEAAKGTGAQA